MDDELLIKLFVTAALVDYRSEKLSIAQYVLKDRGVEATEENHHEILRDLEEIAKVRNKVFPEFVKPPKDVTILADKEGFIRACLAEAKDFRINRKGDEKTGKAMPALIKEIWNSSYITMGSSSVDFLDCEIVGAFWDFSNCRLPSSYIISDLRENIVKYMNTTGFRRLNKNGLELRAFYEHYMRNQEVSCYTNERISMTYAYREAHGDTDTGDKAMIADMVDWAHRYLDKHKEPTTILVISGDLDMLHAIKTVQQLGFMVILVEDANAGPILLNSVDMVYDWTTVITPKKKTT